VLLCFEREKPHYLYVNKCVFSLQRGGTNDSGSASARDSACTDTDDEELARAMDMHVMVSCTNPLSVRCVNCVRITRFVGFVLCIHSFGYSQVGQSPHEAHPQTADQVIEEIDEIMQVPFSWLWTFLRLLCAYFGRVLFGT
jgi:hypothetical protein